MVQDRGGNSKLEIGRARHVEFLNNAEPSAHEQPSNQRHRLARTVQE